MSSMANLAHSRLLKIIKGADKVRPGLDYLRLNFEKPLRKFDAILNRLNLTNSNLLVDGEFTYVRLRLASGDCLQVLISYEGLAVPVFLYNMFGERSANFGKYARLDFYGSYFRLVELGVFHENYIENMIALMTDEDPSISRIDYCLDLFYNDKHRFPTKKSMFTSINDTTKGVSFTTGDKETSWSCGSKSAKRYLVRMYDKLADISVKGKYFMYDDYLTWKSVHRFEVQYGPKFTRGSYLSQLGSLIHKSRLFLKLDNDSFCGLMFYKYENNTKITEYNKLHFTKQLVGRANTFVKAGINPYIVLYNGLQGVCPDLNQKYYRAFIANFKK